MKDITWLLRNKTWSTWSSPKPICTQRTALGVPPVQEPGTKGCVSSTWFSCPSLQSRGVIPGLAPLILLSRPKIFQVLAQRSLLISFHVQSPLPWQTALPQARALWA